MDHAVGIDPDLALSIAFLDAFPFGVGIVDADALVPVDLDDEALRDAKKGQFYYTEGQRMLANNSAVYLTKPDTQTFLDEWTALVKSGSGERGIFNRGGLSQTLPERRLKQWKGVILPSFGRLYFKSIS